MAEQARVKIHKMQKVASTDEVIQEILKQNPQLLEELKDVAEDIRTAAQSNFVKKGHPEVAVGVRAAEGVNRTNIRVSAVSTDPNHEGAAPYIEAKYGALKKALRAVKKARKQAGNS